MNQLSLTQKYSAKGKRGASRGSCRIAKATVESTALKTPSQEEGSQGNRFVRWFVPVSHHVEWCATVYSGALLAPRLKSVVSKDQT